MQDGDLATFRRPCFIIVVEGVLCTRTPITEEKGRFRKRDVISGYQTMWHETPMKRTQFIFNKYGEQLSVNLVTFEGDEFAEEAADFLGQVGMEYHNITAENFGKFCTSLRFRTDVLRVYDVDPSRLDQYGQYGTAVVSGGDF